MIDHIKLLHELAESTDTLQPFMYICAPDELWLLFFVIATLTGGAYFYTWLGDIGDREAYELTYRD